MYCWVQILAKGVTGGGFEDPEEAMVHVAEQQDREGRDHERAAESRGGVDEDCVLEPRHDDGPGERCNDHAAAEREKGHVAGGTAERRLSD